MSAEHAAIARMVVELYVALLLFVAASNALSGPRERFTLVGTLLLPIGLMATVAAAGGLVVGADHALAWLLGG